MTLKNAKIEFDDKQIINLKGYSDSGKSAFLRALEVCLDNYRPASQTKFIRDGEKYFAVSVEFDDGVIVRRYKFNDGKSLYEMFKGKDLIYTSKRDGNLLPIKDVPEVIKEYVDLARLENSGILNFRRNTDKQFLSETTGAENFQDLNKLFGVDEITTAISLVKQDESEIKEKIENNTMTIEYNRGKVKEFQGITDELIKVLMEKEKEVNAIEARATKLRDLSGLVGDLVELPVSEEVETIQATNPGIVSLFEGLEEFRVLEDVPILPEIEEVEALRDVQNLKEIVGELLKTGALDEVEEVNSNAKSLESGEALLELLEDGLELDEQVGKINEQIDKMRDWLGKAVQVLKAKGTAVTQCSNCGEFTLVDGGHAHG